jgi:molybdenum cofactor synthesis domain-containing protein
MISVGILTISDKGARGERKDEGGPLIKEMVQNIGWEVAVESIVPDEKLDIERKLREYADKLKVNVVLTTGGTGFSPRDITPEATLAVIEKQIPGIPQAMLFENLKITPRAMLSRAVAGIRGQTIIINLPGSPKAVKECLSVVLPCLGHGVETMLGITWECASKFEKN